jgi:HK97 family phage portal protein
MGSDVMSLHIRNPFYKDTPSPQKKGYFQEWLGSEINKIITDKMVSRREYSQKVGDGSTSDLLMATLLWVARRMAESPIGVQTLGDETINFMHPLARLLKHPSPFFSGSAFIMAQVIMFLTHGNAYALKIRNGHLNVIGLQAIPYWAIKPHVPIVGYIDYYEYYPVGSGSVMVKILPEDLVHLRYGVDPNNMRLGISPLRILLESLYTDVEASMFTAMLLKNAGVIGTIISPKEGGARMGSLGDDEKTAKRIIQEEFRGTKTGDVMIMTGPTQVDYMGVDASKMDLARLRNIPEERVSAIFGVPAAVVGLGTGLQNTKVGATMSEMRAMAYEDCIIPTQQLWCDEWDLQLMPEFEVNVDTYRVAFDNSKVRVLQEDINKVTDRALKELQGGAISLIEYREQKGYETKGIPNVMYLPMSVTVIPLDQLGEDTEDQTEVPEVPGEAPDAEDQTEGPEPKASDAEKKTAVEWVIPK